MTDKEQDLFGKIDAILERRDADVLTNKCTSSDDFPMLTEVIEGGLGRVWVEPDRSVYSPSIDECRLSDRRVGERRQSAQAGPIDPVLRAEMERMLAAMEFRLTDVFNRQLLLMEQALRKVIRDALARDRGSLM